MITNQHIAIVGGTAGIGLAVAQMAADAGAEVRLAGSSRDRLDQALRQIDGKVKGELVDVRDEDSIADFLFTQARLITSSRQSVLTIDLSGFVMDGAPIWMTFSQSSTGANFSLANTRENSLRQTVQSH